MVACGSEVPLVELPEDVDAEAAAAAALWLANLCAAALATSEKYR